ncbi:uncharacterized protein C8R40DRAFT_1268146, partial [Lentinula edodes]|uniref:uncharacterized protein n=1 Tax=Lentinula edodes TaxID=5353 RepID=UPI001E8EB069
MGFFSSRRTDGDFVVHDREGSKTTTTTTVVQVIRSRFYGKHRTDADSRATANSGTFIAQDGSTASTLGHPGQSLRKSQSTPFSATIRKASGSSRLKNVHTSSSTNLRSTESSNTKDSGLFESSGFFHLQAGTSSSKSTYGRHDATGAPSTVSAIRSASAPSGARISRTDNATYVNIVLFYDPGTKI